MLVSHVFQHMNTHSHLQYISSMINVYVFKAIELASEPEYIQQLNMHNMDRQAPVLKVYMFITMLAAQLVNSNISFGKLCP